eukprot:TRINITY_DN41905_c0_g1_i1.p1 TRINITY_DN41905_c0_g1~~TRINITY_DN41905_c0_g1_i1.p1  ORF type:complete len:750 (+),score=156.63 TRINITY_DN41905_c0_g1_i1:102-2351(+)
MAAVLFGGFPEEDLVTQAEEVLDADDLDAEREACLLLGLASTEASVETATWQEQVSSRVVREGQRGEAEEGGGLEIDVEQLLQELLLRQGLLEEHRTNLPTAALPPQPLATAAEAHASSAAATSVARLLLGSDASYSMDAAAAVPHATAPSGGYIGPQRYRGHEVPDVFREMRRATPLSSLSESAQTTLLGGTLYAYSEEANLPPSRVGTASVGGCDRGRSRLLPRQPGPAIPPPPPPLGANEDNAQAASASSAPPCLGDLLRHSLDRILMRSELDWPGPGPPTCLQATSSSMSSLEALMQQQHSAEPSEAYEGCGSVVDLSARSVRTVSSPVNAQRAVNAGQANRMGGLCPTSCSPRGLAVIPGEDLSTTTACSSMDSRSRQGSSGAASSSGRTRSASASAGEGFLEEVVEDREENAIGASAATVIASVAVAAAAAAVGFGSLPDGGNRPPSDSTAAGLEEVLEIFRLPSPPSAPPEGSSLVLDGLESSERRAGTTAPASTVGGFESPRSVLSVSRPSTAGLQRAAARTLTEGSTATRVSPALHIQALTAANLASVSAAPPHPGQGLHRQPPTAPSDTEVLDVDVEEEEDVHSGTDEMQEAMSPTTARSESYPQSARTVLGEMNLEGSLDGGLARVLHRLALENLALDESLSRSVRRVLQLGTVLTGYRLSDEEIAALPKVRFEDGPGSISAQGGGSAPATSCSICLEAYQTGELLTALRCCHFFHVDCLRVWFQRSTQCPLCRMSQD